ncbi:lipoprotein signal peptidase [uncultured Sunxiuqinia sp.]|jgi:signal peptidase II|uniref:lipoprotein signal peptidase n=1 Tax=uncultured Sunxiuqinia sp. TaxID=1573825 RepID=UPI0019C0ABB5|nr:lipoprotein signal peptidase [Sunxiuqinia sp.]
MSRLTKSLGLVFLILLIDQLIKVWIKTNMYLGQEFPVLGDWFLIHFVENNGMAFGIEFAGEYGKIFLSLFRVVAVAGIGWYLFKLIKKEEIPMGFIACIALIFAGAIGNIIDSAFYGLIFNESYGQIAQFLPDEGGYSSFLHGKVVDMLYFPLFSGRYPQWLPFWGGNDFLFFRPVFNIADSAITIGIFSILIFYRQLFSQLEDNKEQEPETLTEKASEHDS